MRKNWTMRAAGLMLALVLITSCFVGGTFAKYTTAATGNDSARVAKFGVTITANGNMFAKEYDEGVTAKTVISDGTDDKNLVAPGTKGNMVSMTLTGKPEVAVKVSYDATDKVVLSDNWKDKDGNFYCPLVFTIKGDHTSYIHGTDYNNVAALQTAIETEIKAYSKEYEPNTDLATVGTDSLAISWEWPFSTSEENDVKDTYLGDQAAAGNAATVSVEVTTTVTQID